MSEEKRKVEIKEEDLEKVAGGKCRGDEILNIDSSNPLCPKCNGNIRYTKCYGDVDFYECESCQQGFCRLTVGDIWYYYE